MAQYNCQTCIVQSDCHAHACFAHGYVSLLIFLKCDVSMELYHLTHRSWMAQLSSQRKVQFSVKLTWIPYMNESWSQPILVLVLCDIKQTCLNIVSHFLQLLNFMWRYPSGCRFTINKPSYQHRDYHYKDKTVSRSPYRYDGNTIPGTTVFIWKQGPNRDLKISWILIYSFWRTPTYPWN